MERVRFKRKKLEDMSSEELDEHVNLLNNFYKAWAFIGGSMQVLQDMEVDLEQVKQVSFTWKDGYSVQLKYKYGHLPHLQKGLFNWGGRLSHIIRFIIPLHKDELDKPHGIAGSHVSLWVSKKEGDHEADFLTTNDPNEVENVVWWPTIPRHAEEDGERHPTTYAHSEVDIYPKSLQELTRHLEKFPESASAHAMDGNEIPFEFPLQYVSQYLEYPHQFMRLSTAEQS